MIISKNSCRSALFSLSRLRLPVCILLTLFFDSCARDCSPVNVFVENFRSAELTDDEVIQKAIECGGPGAQILFHPNKVYTLNNRLLVKEFQILVGNNATLRRADQSFTLLGATATASSDSLVVDSVPKGWEVGDQLQVFTNASFEYSNAFGDYHRLPNIIKAIESNRIYISSEVGGSLNGSIGTWPVGTFVRKVFPMLRGDSLEFKSVPFTVINMNFDGNKSNNNLNYYWNVNATVFVKGLGSKIEDCRFYNIPNENIVGQGVYIANCQAYGLNGSFVHLSGVDTVNEYLQKNSIITGNTVNGVCQLSNALTGHSEGAFTTSYNGGYATISNNRIYNCNEAAIGVIDAPYDIADGGKSEFIITNNLFKNCRKIVYDIYPVKEGLKPSSDIYIANNIFSNCGYNDWKDSKTFTQYPGFKIGDNNVTNNTYWNY